jgi:hypothetical protein
VIWPECVQRRQRSVSEHMALISQLPLGLVTACPVGLTPNSAPAVLADAESRGSVVSAVRR